MIDIHLLRQQLDDTVRRLQLRGVNFDAANFTQLENRRKQLQRETEELQRLRNEHAKAMGQAKARGDDTASLLAQASGWGEELASKEQALEHIRQELHNLLSTIPNLAADDVPLGQSEQDNVELRRWGQPASFDFLPKDHVTLGENLQSRSLIKSMDFERAVTIAGTRFVVLTGLLAQLQRALARFMLDLHTTEHGYTEVYVPYLANQHSLFGTGQLPKFRADQFHLQGEPALSLIPTAEVSLTNLVRDLIVPHEQLPMKLVAHTPCFRSEAGSYGKDTRGMIRQHQFEKVELVHIVHPDDSIRAHEELVSHAEKVLQLLELPYRVVTLCTGDMGFSARKTYDLEVWLPAQNCYREISSCSHCGDFQARRLQARFRHPVTQKPELLHTLNGSGLAVGRTLVAIMENYQNAQGHIHVPRVLQPYLNGLSVIR